MRTLMLLLAIVTLVPATAGAQEPMHHDGKHPMKMDKAKSDAKIEGMVEMWVCESDPTIGLSVAGACPLDGKPLVKKAVDLSKVTDVANKKCPIMGGDVDPATFAIYKGKRVAFCCPGCAGKFFADAEGAIKKLEHGAPAHEMKMPEGAHHHE